MKISFVLLLAVLPLATAQSRPCPLPNKDDIEKGLKDLLLNADASGSYDPTLQSYQYTCLAQGSIKDTYRRVSIIGTFIPNSGQSQRTEHFQLECISGIWSAVTNHGFETPPSDPRERRDCFTCVPENFLGDSNHCFECNANCRNLGQGSCVASALDCCPFFNPDGVCTTSCPNNYIANNNTNYTCICNYTCGPGEVRNSTCDGCNLIDICKQDKPCKNGGLCILLSAPDNYTCDCSGTGYMGTNCTVISSCVLPNNITLLPGQSQIFLHTPSSGADILLIVDESGSMDMEHQWIVNMTKALDMTLKDIKIGISSPNLFGIVGFGSSYEGDSLSRILFDNGNMFVTSTDITRLTDQLLVSGRYEDGYAAIQFSINQYQFRNGAKQFVLISDEERDVRQSNIDSDAVLRLLENNNIVLNVAISQSFQSGSGLRALGLDNKNKTYIYDPLSANLFHVATEGGPVKDTAHKTTYFDYTQLALDQGGAAWDLSLLRQGGNVAKAFTNAFVQVKAIEIFHQMTSCLNCTCEGNLDCVSLNLTGDTHECNFTHALLSRLPMKEKPTNSIKVAVLPKRLIRTNGTSNATLSCTILSGQGDIKWTFNGGKLPTKVTVVTTAATSTLTISTVQIIHGGFYTCIARSVDKSELGTDVGRVEVFDRMK